MFPELVALLFYSSEFGRKAHLSTRSRSDHQALHTFYEELVELTDKLVEAYQGRCGKISIPLCDPADPTSEPIGALRNHLSILEAVRYQAVPKEDAPIHSVIDDICLLYLKTLYQLTELK